MTDVDRLLREYIEEHSAGGEADPLAYVEQLEGADRAELEALIDAYLARAPGREWDPEAYRGSPAEQVVTALTESLAGVSGSWPCCSPSFETRRGSAATSWSRSSPKRSASAAARRRSPTTTTRWSTGCSSRPGSPTACSTPSPRSSTSPAMRCEEPVERVAPPEAGEGAVFARKARLDADYGGEALTGAPASAAEPARGEAIERDEVDELFLGG